MTFYYWRTYPYYWQRKLRTQILEAAAPQLVQLEPVPEPDDMLRLRYRGAELKLPESRLLCDKCSGHGGAGQQAEMLRLDGGQQRFCIGSDIDGGDLLGDVAVVVGIRFSGSCFRKNRTSRF